MIAVHIEENPFHRVGKMFISNERLLTTCES